MDKSEEIRELLSKYPGMKTSEVAETVGCSRRWTRSVIRDMLRSNVSDIKAATGHTLTPDDHDFEGQLSKMTGYGVNHMTPREKEFLGNLVMQIERSLKRVPVVNLESHSDSKESAVLLISDIHAGKQTYNDKGDCLYNKDIMAFRMSLLKERVVKLLTVHQRAERFDEVVILLLGDLVDGAGIYPNQELHQDITPFTDQISIVTAAIWDIVKRINSEMPNVKIRIEAVPGNHGRQGKYTPAENNFDYLIFQSIYMMSYYEDMDVSVNYSLAVPYLNTEIKGMKVHLRHIAPPQAETPAMRGRFLGWKDIHKFEIACSAHLHHPGINTIMDASHFMNGSPVGMDDLAERMAVKSRPSQTLFGIDPKLGVSFRYDVYLDMFGEGGDADALLKRYPMLKESL